MKLITEVTEDIQYISEEKNGKRHLYIEGVFLQSNITNRNNRSYPKEIMRKEVDRYRTEQIDKKRAMGELGHPDGAYSESGSCIAHDYIFERTR